MKTTTSYNCTLDCIVDKTDCDAVAVSVSLGNPDRDHSAIINILNRKIKTCRIGVSGDLKAMAGMLSALDGKVDALGIGGADLGCLVQKKWYPFHSITRLLQHVHHTPVVDGSGLKIVLERNISVTLNESDLAESLPKGRTAFLTTGCNRWGMLEALNKIGFDTVYGDFMFGLGLPIAIHDAAMVRLIAGALLPIVGFLPFSWLYPTGENQNRHITKWQCHFDRASIIAGDTHYITHCMPRRLEGKVIIVNTTTENDITLFKQAGAAAVITTTPRYNGRTFGANVMEAALIAASGRKTPVDYKHCSEYIAELDMLIGKVGFKPVVVYP